MRFFLAPVFLAAAVFLHAGGGREKAAQENDTGPVSSAVRLSGIVRLVGSEPFPDLVISGQYEWYIERDEQQKLKDLQHRKVTIEAVETVSVLIFANGTPMGERRTLRDIKIISVE